MNLRHVVRVVGGLLLALTAPLAASGLAALAYGDGDAPAFLLSALLVAPVGGVAYLKTSTVRDLSLREGYAIVSLGWLAVGLAGALPYLLSGVLSSPVAALFESVSGFTTTGATVFGDVESLPRGILLWRALTQWLGGMGIIVLGIAILPFLGVGGMQLFRAEVPGPTPTRLQPRIVQTAKILWYVYTGLTAVQVGLYVAGGLSAFEAVTHAFTTLSTGGFSTRNASLAAFPSPYVQYVTIAFMYLAGVNFSLHYRALSGKPGAYLEDAQWRFYTIAFAGATVLVTGALLLQGARAEDGLEPVFRETLFQVVSLGTTTGFVTADYELWAAGPQVVLLLLMFMGGMAGSTTGGMKVVRIHFLLRYGLTELVRSLHPRAVVVTRVGRQVVAEGTQLNILAFILLFLLLYLAGVLALAFLGHDLVTSIGASVAAIANIGPGWGDVGPTKHYGGMDPASALVLVFLMLAGRLEIFTVLLLFHPDLWRRAERPPSRPRARPPAARARE